MTQAKNNVCRCFGLYALLLLLTGCASLELEDGTWADSENESTQTQSDTTTPLDLPGTISDQTIRLSAEQLEQSAANKPHPEKDELLLYAASAYLDKGKLNKAEALLEQTNQQKLPQILQLRKEALYAALAIEHNDLNKAHEIINHLQAYKSSDPVFNDWIILAQTKLYKKEGDFLQLLEVMNLQSDLLQNEQKQQHLQQIWTLVQEQNLEQLNLYKQQTRRKSELGWIELGIIDKKRSITPPAIWQQSLILWQNAYQDHPAKTVHNQYSEAVAAELDESGVYPNSAIALLLPLSSAYQEIAQTIRDGFQAAAAAKGHRVKVYDTGPNLDQVQDRYQQAISQGAQIIVGPLGKAAVNNLVHATDLVKPTILLGSIDIVEDMMLTPETFMFSLDPEHEAETIANLAYNRGYNRAAILYPESGRGKRLNHAFIQRWQQLGGNIAASIPYNNELYEAITPVNRLLSSASPDVIFLASNAQHGRLLSQVIGERRPNTAIFATSSIYSGQFDPTRDFVLDNVIFTDMPWMINGFSNAQFRKQQLATDRLQAPNSLDRYFAFGVDAYALAIRLPQFMRQPGASIKGVTGNIQLQGNRFRLTRSLVQFVEGKPEPVN